MRLTSNPFVIAFFLAAISAFYSCHPGENSPGQKILVANAPNTNFADYWYAGEAELNSYNLEQLRYGEMRTGEEVMVFVTEDFSKSKEVKLDDPGKAGNDKVSVMKMNNLRKFITGIYDYSMMQSVFTPIDYKQYPHSLKTTTSSQDWCGQAFMQFNLEGDKYKMNQYSYFEEEGDQLRKSKTDLLEDELWTRIRIEPNSLKEGLYDVIPSTFYSRLTHDVLKPKQARITFDKQGGTTFLVLEYMHLDRTLRIGYMTAFPHKILSWTEMQDGSLLSKGTLKSSVKSAYWRQHDKGHEFMRDSLRL